MNLLFLLLFLQTVSVTRDFIVTLPEENLNTVYLTFDLCPTSSGYHLDFDIVNFLIKNNIPATFFISGRWLETHFDEAKILKNELFSIGSHGYRHLDFSRVDNDKIFNELKKTQILLENFFGRKSCLFRFPYGRYDTNSLKLVRDFGLLPVFWNIETGDPDKNIDAKKMVQSLKDISSGSIIIMHANGRGVHTKEALPLIVNDLLNRGFIFKKLPENLCEKF